MSSRKWAAWAAVSSWAAIGSVAAAAAPAYYDLGPSANVSGLSGNGGVASGYFTAGQFFHWTPSAGVTLIGGVAPGDGVGGSAAISEDGNFIGGNTRDANDLSQMSRYNRSTASWQLLGGIGASSGGEGSSAWGLSGDGQVVVGLGWVSGGSANAIRWTSPGPTQNLGTTVPGNSSRANATNGDGSVIVGWQDTELGRQAAIWNGGVQTVLFDGADPLLEASDVSSDGKWVVGQGGFGEPYRYNRSTNTLQRLGLLDPNAFFPSRGATGVSDDGKVIVGFERDFANPFGGTAGTIWIEGQGIQNLTTYALSLGVVLPEFRTLTIPLAISADGSTIAGIDNFFNGFVIVLPEPTALLLLPAFATGALARRRSRA